MEFNEIKFAKVESSSLNMIYKYPLITVLSSVKIIRNRSIISFCICLKTNFCSLKYSYYKRNINILSNKALIFENTKARLGSIPASAKFESKE